LLSQNYASFIGINGKLFQHTCQSWWDKKALKHATNCGTNGASTKFRVGVLPQNGNILTDLIVESIARIGLEEEVLGIPSPLCADWWCSDSCLLGA